MLTTVVSETQNRLQLRRKMRQGVSLHAEKDNVDRPHFFERARDRGTRHEISLAAFHLHAMLLHGAKMRPARKERDVEPGLRHARADVGADCARSSDQESHV